MSNFKTQEYVDSIMPRPGVLLVKLFSESNSFYSGGLITMVEAPKTCMSGIVVRTGGSEYMLSNGTMVKSNCKEGEEVIIDPAAYSAHMSFVVGPESSSESHVVYRLIPEYVVVASINKGKGNKVNKNKDKEEGSPSWIVDHLG